MMIRDGGPAFPSQDYTFDDGTCIDGPLGMSLRDYFAAAVMQGNIASTPDHGSFNKKLSSQWAYEIADEMLEARENE